MSDPELRVRLSPEELARLVAERLAEDRVHMKSASVRIRAVAGLFVSPHLAMAMTVVLVAGAMVWVLLGPVGPEEARLGQLADPREPVAAASTHDPTTSTIQAEVLGSSFSREAFGEGVVTTTEAVGLLPWFPPPLTSPSSPGSATIDRSSPEPPRVNPPTSSPASTATSSTTTTTGATTSSTTATTVATTTTTTSQASTTTAPTTTTSIPASTTIPSTTISTRCGIGNGNGNCP